jgi:transposase InsO family protein
VTEKFEFIDGEKDNYPLVWMFAWMDISKSGYYEWRGRPDSVTARRRAGLKELIQQIFAEYDETYGYRRIHAELNRRGVPCGPELIRALVRELGLVACQPRPWRLTTIPDADVVDTPDLVKRNFTAEDTGAKLVGDITYIKTWNGWLYLATVIDCYTKMVVGYAMATHMETALIRAAIDMAARNITLPKDAIFHSDRGSQYTSAEFRGHLRRLGIRPSLGRTGICYDNAMAESFNAALKTELVYRTAFPTHEHARKAIARYIEFFYNRKRLHSGLGYRIPIEVHDEYLNRQLAA